MIDSLTNVTGTPGIDTPTTKKPIFSTYGILKWTRPRQSTFASFCPGRLTVLLHLFSLPYPPFTTLLNIQKITSAKRGEAPRLTMWAPNRSSGAGSVAGNYFSSPLFLCPSSRVVTHSAQQWAMHLWLRKTSVWILAGRLFIQNKTKSPGFFNRGVFFFINPTFSVPLQDHGDIVTVPSNTIFAPSQ